MYKDKYGQQIDGVTMGSSTDSTVANFCPAYFEKKLLKYSLDKQAFPGVFSASGYVDDIFCMFRSGMSHKTFLSKLKNFHPNMKFTSEIGSSQLSFLDTYISLPTLNEESITPKVFRKSTYTGPMLNFSAMFSQKCKFGLIKCFFHRAYMISNSCLLFSNEVDFLKRCFFEERLS